MEIMTAGDGAPATSAPVDHASRTGWGRTARSMPSVAARAGSSRTSRGFFALTSSGSFAGVACRQRRVARRRQGVAHVAQRLGVVVDHQDGRLVSPVAGPGRCAPTSAAAAGAPPAGTAAAVGAAAGFAGRRRRGGGPGEQVGDEAAQVVGLLVDDAEELQHLGRVEGGRGAQHGAAEPLMAVRGAHSSCPTAPSSSARSRSSLSRSASMRAMRRRSASFSRRRSSALCKGPPRRPGAARFYPVCRAGEATAPRHRSARR